MAAYGGLCSDLNSICASIMAFFAAEPAEKDQHGVCFYRHVINWRDELLQLRVTIEVIVAEKERQRKAEQQKSIERRTEINRRIAEEKKKKQYKSQLSLFDD